MTRRLIHTCLVLALAWAPSLRAQSGSVPATLDDLSWLVGGVWVADSRTAAGAPATTEVVYRWAIEGKALAYSLVRRAATGEVDTRLEGLSGWHPGRQRVVLWEIDSQGTLTEGVFGEQGRLDEVITANDGKPLTVRSNIERKDDNRFVFTAAVERDGRWVTVFQADYRRSRR